MAGKPLGERALTATERQRRWRAKVRKRKLLGGRRENPAFGARTDDDDLFSTPPCLIAALIQFVLPTLPAAPIWDPAAGDGRALVDSLRTTGREVIATDIEPQRRDIARLDY